MNRKMIKLTIFASIAMASIQVSAAGLDAGAWLVRGGVATVQPNDDSGTVTGIANSGVSVDSDTQLGLTVTYMLTENIGVGILASTPFTHDVSGEGSISGLGKIVEATQLPPTVTLQYHFQSESKYKPYIGAGVNYTIFFDEEASSSLEGALGGPTTVSLDNSFGLALEAGIDIDISDGWYLNFAAWYIDIDTTAILNTGGTLRSVDVEIDPWVWMAGFGKRF